MADWVIPWLGLTRLGGIRVHYQHTWHGTSRGAASKPAGMDFLDADVSKLGER
jgi:hypothetical protein